MRTAPNSNDLRSLTPAERIVAAVMALREPGRKRARARVEDQIKRDLDYGRDR